MFGIETVRLGLCFAGPVHIYLCVKPTCQIDFICAALVGCAVNVVFHNKLFTIWEGKVLQLLNRSFSYIITWSLRDFTCFMNYELLNLLF